VKAIAAVVAVHAALAFVLLSGLNVGMVRHAVDRLNTIDLIQPPPPPPLVEPPPKPQPAKKAAGAIARKTEPSSIVAPESKLPVPSPIPAAKIAGASSATTSGAAVSGAGAGADGDFSGFTPARRITKIPDREYRVLASTGLRSGSVGVTIRVNPDGSVSNCRVARSSGDGSVDAMMCELTLRYVRFDPARDRAGRPVAQDITFFPNWWRQ
jgi:protein TonB